MTIKAEYDLRVITADVVEWCDKVFPERTRDHMITKLQEEFAELGERPLDAWEMADIFIVLVDLAHELGFDLAKVAAHKMDINKNHRQWAVNEQGILKHVKTPRHSEGGDDQALAHSQHGAGADPSGTPVQRRDPNAGTVSTAGVCPSYGPVAGCPCPRP